MPLILESIVTTSSPEGRAHIAPMGVEERQGLVLLQPFRPSTTLENVLATGVAVVNRCDDVRIFAGCLSGRRDWPLAPSGVAPCKRLEAALSHLELRLERVEEDETRPRLYLRPVAEHNHRPFQGLNRARAAVLELAILVSRLSMLPAEKVDRELEYLTIAIDKTAGPAELEAWGWLMERVAAHRAGGAK